MQKFAESVYHIKYADGDTERVVLKDLIVILVPLGTTLESLKEEILTEKQV